MIFTILVLVKLCGPMLYQKMRVNPRYEFVSDRGIRYGQIYMTMARDFTEEITINNPSGPINTGIPKFLWGHPTTDPIYLDGFEKYEAAILLKIWTAKGSKICVSMADKRRFPQWIIDTMWYTVDIYGM